MEALKDASHLFEVDRYDVHAERPGFRIAEYDISATQRVPWHYHNHIADTFYVLEGRLRIYLQNPKESVDLAPGETFTVVPKRPHMTANALETTTTFLVLQGIGDYDYVPLV